MLTRLVKRVVTPGTTQVLNASSINNFQRHRRILGAVRPAVSSMSIRHQSSSSSSRRDNDNNSKGSSSSADVESIPSKDAPINASFELHRIDLAHGSFFALHRPLLGITNGPMFTSSNNNMMNDEDYEGNPLTQPALITPTATTWASLSATMPDAEQAVDEFLTQMEHRQQQQQQQQSAKDIIMESTSSTSTSSVTSSASPGTNPVITADAILDPLLDASNAMHLTSVLRKRRIKMRKHKYQKLRKRTRALRKKLGK
ncbi:hypothetical protein BG011_003725 [Mortierella polycephala]|uniref:Small ribosomal subunit protein mS38 n=1 Tax=Mortierella polycephala TaxID=41804 RepID=A0A9P6U3C5_9FUNG|nr:hypothetical protein BG011_003725 [Mortierella polycephala]